MHYLLQVNALLLVSYHTNTTVMRVLIVTMNIALQLVDNYNEYCIRMAYAAVATAVSGRS